MAVASSPALHSKGWLQLDPQHAAAVARIVAAARLLFVSVALVAVVLDPPEHIAFARHLAAGLALTVVCSAVALVGAHVVPLTVVRWAPALHVLDFGWILAAIVLTDGANSPFMTCFVFALLASAFQWRLAATLATGAAATAVLIGAVLVQHEWHLGTEVHLNTVLLRTTALVLGTLLIARLAEHDLQQRVRSLAVTRIVGYVTAEAGFVASVRAVLDALLGASGAVRAFLVLREDDSARAFVWSVARLGDAHLRVKLAALPQAAVAPYLFDLPSSIGALRVRLARRSLSVLALDRSGMAVAATGIRADALLQLPAAWRTALCLPGVSGHGWTGRLFILDPAKRRHGRNHLRFLQTVVGQVAPALFNVYLQRRLQSRTGGGERAVVARAMHDSTLQALIGAEMELELLQRETAGELSARTRHRLAFIQELLAEQVLEFRDVIQALKHLDLAPERFLDHIDDLVRRFRDSTGIDARLQCEVEDIDLAARTCRELAGVVREALVNVRKHACASQVIVRLFTTNGDWRLHIVDDGTGFDFCGRFAGEELEKQRRGPVLIRERVKHIGGRLFVDSQPGHGSTLEITLPRRAS